MQIFLTIYTCLNPTDAVFACGGGEWRAAATTNSMIVLLPGREGFFLTYMGVTVVLSGGGLRLPLQPTLRPGNDVEKEGKKRTSCFMPKTRNGFLKTFYNILRPWGGLQGVGVYQAPRSLQRAIVSPGYIFKRYPPSVSS